MFRQNKYEPNNDAYEWINDHLRGDWSSKNVMLWASIWDTVQPIMIRHKSLTDSAIWGWCPFIVPFRFKDSQSHTIWPTKQSCQSGLRRPRSPPTSWWAPTPFPRPSEALLIANSTTIPSEWRATPMRFKGSRSHPGHHSLLHIPLPQRRPHPRPLSLHPCPTGDC